ncbi:MAG: MotA/TolQ/ExbB proton channel family protein [Planctomycetia bacterium]|nr:MotA/TolQ/ExbB proton channel family protein [Planctomycetia bacterium]
MLTAYFEYVKSSPMDWGILAFGTILVLLHIIFLFGRTCRWRWATQGLETRQRVLAMLMEILPLLGLLGTILALLKTFQSIGMDSGTINIHEIISNFAPALTTTASGIIMLVINLVFNTILWRLIPKKSEDQQ